MQLPSFFLGTWIPTLGYLDPLVQFGMLKPGAMTRIWTLELGCAVLLEHGFLPLSYSSIQLMERELKQSTFHAKTLQPETWIEMVCIALICWLNTLSGNNMSVWWSCFLRIISQVGVIIISSRWYYYNLLAVCQESQVGSGCGWQAILSNSSSLRKVTMEFMALPLLRCVMQCSIW